MKTRRRVLLHGRHKMLSLVIILMVVILTAAGCAGALGRGVAQGWAGGVVTSDTVIVGSRGGKIIALDAEDGTIQGDPAVLVTQVPSGGFGCAAGGASGVAIYSSPVISDNLVYVGGYNGKVYAYLFDGESLATEREYAFPSEGYLTGSIVGELALDQEGRVFFGSSDGKVYALDTKLRIQWVYDTGDSIWSAPAIQGDSLFIGSFDKKLYALDIADGSQRWVFETKGAIIAAPLVYGDKVYFGTFGRRFYAVDTASGEEVWRFPADDTDENKPKNWFWAKPLAANGTIYAPNLDGKVYALDADTGALTAEFDLGGPISSSPVMVDGLIIVATENGDIYSLDTADNHKTLLAHLEDVEGEKVYEEKVQAPLFAGDGTVYIHTFRDNLWAISVQTGEELWKKSLTSEDSE
ncbi:MAG: PQQ-binding-like beta-propeller repeat protein [Dehalococcoidales bacterium]|nr:MAG: PQQ-binding-like beta-propeller repeat protein [Dehalococcoidales bacterium]